RKKAIGRLRDLRRNPIGLPLQRVIDRADTELALKRFRQPRERAVLRRGRGGHPLQRSLQQGSFLRSCYDRLNIYLIGGRAECRPAVLGGTKVQGVRRMEVPPAIRHASIRREDAGTEGDVKLQLGWLVYSWPALLGLG